MLVGEERNYFEVSRQYSNDTLLNKWQNSYKIAASKKEELPRQDLNVVHLARDLALLMSAAYSTVERRNQEDFNYSAERLKSSKASSVVINLREAQDLFPE